MSIYDKASLVLIPSGTKTSKVYSQKPTNGDGDFTFSRSTAATRVNASGNIEKETENKLLYSSTFSNGNWVNVNTTIAGGQSGYDGTNDAYLLTKSAASARIHQLIDNDGVQTFSVYAKAGSLNYIMLNNSLVSQWYDLSNGTIGHNSSASNTIDAEIEDVGNGWYRCSLTFPSTIAIVRIYPSQADANVSGSTGNIYIQDAQLEQGLVARDYIETTTTAIYGGITDNVPRLDYTDSSCPALLLEPLRTNLITQSEYTGGYGNFGSTDTANQASSPEGVNNAVLLEGDGTQPQVFFNAPNMTLSSAGSYALSIFAKKGTNNYMQLSLDGFTGAGNGLAYFDLENGTTPSSGASIEDYGNGWYRCILISTIDAGDLFGRVVIRVAPSTSTFLFASPSAANGQNIYIYGFQFEAGSYATSYIPTYGSAVTRNADYSVRSDMQDYVSADEGTWFMNFKDLFFDITGTGQGSINLVYNSGNQIEFIQDGNFQYKITLNNSTAVSNLDGEDKVAIAWSTLGLVIYINGVSRYTSTSSAYANPYLSFELTRIDRRPRVDMKQILFFKTRLSNEELAALTTI